MTMIYLIRIFEKWFELKILKSNYVELKSSGENKEAGLECVLGATMGPLQLAIKSLC
jgi:hypothetical protein